MTELAATGQNSASSDNTSLYTINAWWVFAGICLIYLFFNWWLQTQVFTDQVYYYSLGGRVSAEKLAAFLDAQHHMSFLSYVLVPVTLVIRMTLIAFCLLVGLLLTSQKLSFKAIFKIVLFAESAFAAGVLLRLLLLAFSKDIESLGQFETFAPLSLYSLINPSSVPAWLTYPLQTLDLFQVAYCLLLAVGLRHFLLWPFKKALRLVLYSYGLGLLCCMIAFAFFIFSNS
ncbi:MAG: hypothetical protein J0H74_36270 [Chitinophagaceae bacterium]|nr:hypothetical protein [Chitinophagaceae bacterium]